MHHPVSNHTRSSSSCAMIGILKASAFAGADCVTAGNALVSLL
jgi:hypothetical protein